MNKAEERIIYADALATFGNMAQIDVAIEECCELAVALEHLKRGRASGAEVVDEISDVEVICGQLRLIFGDDNVDARKEYKLNRLHDRILKYKLEHNIIF